MTRDVPALVERARAGDARSVARLISLVEDGSPALPEVAAALAPYAGRAQVVGLTGAPGVGKSTTTNELVRALRKRDRRVGVLAVIPLGLCCLPAFMLLAVMPLAAGLLRGVTG